MMKQTGHPPALPEGAVYCALPRRLAAMLYDGLLLLGLWMAAATIVVFALQREVSPSNLGFQFYLLAVTWAYFALCWRGGHTLGMKAWHITIEGPTRPISWLTTLLRFVLSMVSWAMLGLGFLWSLGHPRKATWHDLGSGTRLIVMPRTRSKK